MSKPKAASEQAAQLVESTVEAQREAEEQILGWQLRGEPSAIEAVASEIGAATQFFFHPYDRVQDAIFAAHRAAMATGPAAIALQLAADEGLAEMGGLEFLRNLAAAAPAIVDVRQSVRAAAQTWRGAKIYRMMAKRTEDAVGMFARGEPGALAELQAIGKDAAEACAASALVATPFFCRDPEAIPRRRFIFSRHGIRGFVSATAAAGGAGKTSLALADALSVCTGQPLLNDGKVERAAVWYIGLEDPLVEYERRVAAARIHHRLNPADLNGLFLDSARDQNFVIAREGGEQSIVVEPVVKAIIAQVRKHNIGLVIVDPFVNCHEVNEQDNGKIAALMKLWAHIADVTGCAIELLHHTRKSNGTLDDDSADDLRGAGAFVNAARSVRRLVRMTKDEAKRAGDRVDDRRRFFRVIRGVKSNLALHTDEYQWRELVSIDLRNGDADGSADTVQAATSWRFPDAADDCSQEQLAAVLDRVRNGEWGESSQAKDWVGKVVADVLGLDVDDEGARTAVKGALKKWMKDGTLRTVDRRDEKTRKTRPFVIPGA